MDSAMVLLLLVLGGVLVYMLFSPTSLIGPWLDKYCKEEKRKWGGEDITPEYNTNQDKQSIHDAITQENQKGIPFTPALEIPFEDPEVPNRPSKTTKKPRKTKTKRVYKKRSKK